MNYGKGLTGLVVVLSLVACSPAKVYKQTKYQLMGINTKPIKSTRRGPSLLVNQPTATAGFDTSRMRYMEKPFVLASFVKNAWVDTPANMVFPLLMQSLQNTHHYRAVVGTPYTGSTDYRLDVKVLRLVQNFIKKPSVVELVLKADVTNAKNRLTSSKTFHQIIPATHATPYGGVVAANQAVAKVMRDAAAFVVAATS